MSWTDLNYISVTIQDLLYYHFKIQPVSKQQNYSNSYIKLLYNGNCSELSIFVTNNRYVWVLFQVKTEEDMEDEVNTILEKIIPINELIPIVELLLSLDNAIIKKAKGLIDFPEKSTSMLMDFRINPYQGETDEY